MENRHRSELQSGIVKRNVAETRRFFIGESGKGYNRNREPHQLLKDVNNAFRFSGFLRRFQSYGNRNLRFPDDCGDLRDVGNAVDAFYENPFDVRSRRRSDVRIRSNGRLRPSFRSANGQNADSNFD